MPIPEIIGRDLDLYLLGWAYGSLRAEIEKAEYQGRHNPCETLPIMGDVIRDLAVEIMRRTRDLDLLDGYYSEDE